MWRDEATLLDIAQAARRIVSFVRGVDEASFAANAEKHWAVVAQLLIIDEFGSIHFLSDTYEGRVHDKCIADEAGYTLPTGSILYLDC